MLKRCLAGSLVITSMLCGCTEKRQYEAEKTVFVMDTAMTVKGSSGDVKAACDVAETLSRLFDRYTPESDIYKINHRENSDISQYTEEIVRQSVELSQEYGSEVSIFAGTVTDCWNIGGDAPKVPTEAEISAALDSMNSQSFNTETMSFADDSGSIDLGSVAKGYALDKIAEQLGDGCCVVSMTSSVLFHGKKPDGKPFTLSIRDPENSGDILGTVMTDACFLSTSGGYERYFEADGKRYIHIFDLATGCPSETDLTSVTVLCGNGMLSDFLSTLIYSGGTEKLDSYMNIPDIKVIAVDSQKKVHLSGGVDFTLTGGSGYTLTERQNE